MPLCERHHHVQVVLEAVDHVGHHQVSGLVVLQETGQRRVGRTTVREQWTSTQYSRDEGWAKRTMYDDERIRNDIDKCAYELQIL